MARRAFTLVEALLVMVIISMTASIAMPRFSQFIANQEIEAAARRVSADLALAQRDARQNSSSRTVSFDVVTNSYRLVGMKDPNRITHEYQVKLNEEPYRAQVISAAFGNDAQIIFNGHGSPDTGGSVVIGVGKLRKTIDIDADMGRSGVRKPIEAEKD